MATAAEDAFTAADLARDLAKIDLIVERHQRLVGDDQLTFADVGTLLHLADEFVVSFKNAYLRARDLGLLSWQVAGADAGALPAGSPEEASRLAEIAAFTPAPSQSRGEGQR